MSKCLGCGASLQNSDINGIGYTTDLNNELCMRCFKIRNYNEYKFVVKDNLDYIKILKNINKTDDLVLLVINLFNINKNLEEINKYINNDILLVLTKRDLLPQSCYDEKLKEYFNNYDLNIIDKVIVSSKKNYNFDELYEKINKYKKSNKVYVIGYTNSGKSTLINKIIYNYSLNESNITTSNLPSTTIDIINVEVTDSLTLVDTPGLLVEGDIVNFIDSKTLKKIIPKKEIKPINYQIKTKQIILIEDLVRIDLANKNILTLYFSNELDIKRVYKDVVNLKNLKKHCIEVLKDSDIVISGLGFINVKFKDKITLYTLDNVEVFVRESLI